MATKKPLTTEELLLAIHEEIKNLHTTLGTGMLKIHEALLADRNVEVVIPHPGTNEPGKIDLKPGAVNVAKDPAPAPGEDEIPRFIQEYVEAHPGCKSADLVKEFKISINKAAAAVRQYGKAAPAKQDEKITVEKLRKKIEEFAEVFNMNEALGVNEQFGGSRKVSGISEVAYEKVFNEMDRRIKEKAAAAGAAGKGASDHSVEKDLDEVTTVTSLTKEDIQKVAKPFVDKHGDPAFRALLKAVGKAEKISLVDPKFYPALHEALANA